MSADNPVYDLLTEALDCAERLPTHPHTLLVDAINHAYEVIELPDWLPQFENLVMAMAETSSYSKKE